MLAPFKVAKGCAGLVWDRNVVDLSDAFLFPSPAAGRLRLRLVRPVRLEQREKKPGFTRHCTSY